MSTVFEKEYCKKIISEAIKEVFEDFSLEENTEEILSLNENEAKTILLNLKNGLKNVEMLEEAKKKKKKGNKKQTSNKKKKKETEDKTLKVMKKQVLSMLNQDKFDMAAVAREVYPNMDDDARRSYVSRQSRGLENIANDKVTTYYKALRSASKGRKDGQI